MNWGYSFGRHIPPAAPSDAQQSGFLDACASTEAIDPLLRSRRRDVVMNDETLYQSPDADVYRGHQAIREVDPVAENVGARKKYMPIASARRRSDEGVERKRARL